MRKCALMMFVFASLFLVADPVKKTDVTWKLDAKFDDKTVIEGNVFGNRVVLRIDGHMRVFHSRRLDKEEREEILSELTEDPGNVGAPGLDELCVLPMDELGKIMFFVTASMPDKSGECRLGVCAWRRSNKEKGDFKGNYKGKWTMGVWSFRTLGWEKNHPGESIWGGYGLTREELRNAQPFPEDVK